MKKAKKLTKSERNEISILREKGYGIREIGRALNRSPGTISEELKRNRVRGVYDSRKAHEKARARKKRGKAGWRKLNQNNELRSYVIETLKEGWNPDEIAGRMKKEKQPFYVSKTAIYSWLRTSRGERYCEHPYSKRKRVKRRKTVKTKRQIIPNRTGVERRNAGANNRTRYGHWESDAVASGKNGSGSLAVSQERKTRYGVMTLCETMSPREHGACHRTIVDEHNVLSMTFDNGIENAHHEQLQIPTFFADPYASWQKGGVENFNKMIRRYVPEGSDISLFSQKEITAIQNNINNKPRKILGYATSRELAEAAGIITSGCSD